jgi:hypothetical protein
VGAVSVSRCEPSTSRDTNDNEVANKNTTATPPPSFDNRDVKWSGGETLFAVLLTVVGHLVGIGTSGDRPLALGTIDVDGVAVFANSPIAADTACMTAIGTVKCRLWRRRESERVDRGQRSSVYSLQADNLRVSMVRVT